MKLDWSTDPPRRSVWAVVGAAPGWPFNLFVAGILAVGLLAASSPGGYWVPLLAVFLFLVAPLLVVGAWLLVEVEVPVRVRFEPSRAGFTQLAEELMELGGRPADRHLRHLPGRRL